PYDSDEARAFTSAMTAVMTGESYATSAEMARVLGPFPGYAANERHMLRVIRNHRRAAYDAPTSEYEGLSVLPMPLDQSLAPAPLVQAAHEAWDRALAGGELYGYRNAQTTLLAPTGTIGLLMDCDTTGVEPDFALVKFKKLAGGGYFKIANQSIKPALRNLGYSEQERTDILTYVLGTLSLEGSPYINRATLKERGFTDADLDRIETGLPGVFELGFAFSPWSLGEEALSHVGVTMEQATAAGFDLLRHLGFSRSQIEAANERICGTMTIEGAPHLKPEHLPVFDTANKCGKKGTRFIHHMGHIKMMAAAQSFLSGAISKTINMPNEATYDDILDAYHQSWVHGLKAMALYRDGSKSSQPLSAKSDTKVDADDVVEDKIAAAVAAAKSEWAGEQAAAVAKAVLEAREQWEAEQAANETATRVALSPAASSGGQLRFIDEQHHAVRRRLPARRRGFTQEARVAGQKVYLRTGEYDDGSLGEIFIDIAKEGAAFRSMINCFAIAVSKGLQYGVPLDEFVDTFTFVRFEPQGMVTGHPNIKMATSMIDYVFRVLGLEYLGRTDLVQNPDTVDSDGGDEVPAATGALFPNWTATPAVAESGSAVEPVEDAPENPKAEAGSEPIATAAVPAPVVTIVPDAPARNGSMNGNNGNGPNGHVAQNGNGHAHAVASAPATQVSALDAALGGLMGDAPFCDVCGHITVRNGACYKCLNCGNSLGCS
ncbi:MAG TPA: hypothetical protein VEQ36_16820, partial [Thermomicrobiales bacterium]|nr:hypothetical protein [Thermomicrobiales bacterium]